MRKSMVGFVVGMAALMYAPLCAMNDVSVKNLGDETKTVIEKKFTEITELEMTISFFENAVVAQEDEIKKQRSEIEKLDADDVQKARKRLDDETAEAEKLKVVLVCRREEIAKRIQELQNLIGVLPAVRKHRARKKTNS